MGSVDGSRSRSTGCRVARLDLPHARSQPHGYGRDETIAHARDPGTVSVHPTSLLRFGCRARRGDFVDDGELVRAADGRAGVRAVGREVTNRGRPAAGSIRRFVPSVPIPDWPFLASDAKVSGEPCGSLPPMPRPPGRRRKTLDVPDLDAWRAWLAAHHDVESEIWLVFYKRATARPSIAYEDAVEEALCFGWVDSLVARLDDRRYARKFTPRKPASSWSDLNRTRYAR